MKRISLFFLSSILLLSCSSEDQQEINKAPSQPQLLAPKNNLFCTTEVQNFTWAEASDPEEDDIVYRLDISTNPEFANLFYSSETQELSKSVTLEKGETFYWRVLALDSNGNESDFSDKRSLYTEGEATTNYLPTAPVVLSPDEASVLNVGTVKLSWEAQDPDGDQILYDLYFGKNSEPDRIEEDLQNSSYEVDLEPSTTYYWKIIVKDEHNGKTSGPVWSFSTK